MKTRIPFFLIFTLMFLVSNIMAQTAEVTGNSSTVVVTEEDYTCTLSGSLPTNCTIDYYHWYSNSSTIKINGTTNTSDDDDYTSSTSSTMTFEWDCNFEPADDFIFCDVYFTGSSCVSAPISAPSFTVTVGGYPSGINITGDKQFQECCTDPVHYVLNDYGASDQYFWSVPSGWSNIVGQGTHAITVTPDLHSGGDVSCYCEIQSVPASCNRTVTLTTSRIDPILVITQQQIGQPCEGETVVYHTSLPCNIIQNTISWDFPDGWQNITVNGNAVSAYVGPDAKPGDIMVSANFTGGCTGYGFYNVTPIHSPPLEPTFVECPYYDPNHCVFGVNRICRSGGTIKVEDFTISSNPEENPTSYDCGVSSPWQLSLNGNTASSFSNVPINEINNVIIFLPNGYNTIPGSYRVIAVNCVGYSSGAQYDFLREVDWWCECDHFVACLCPPLNCNGHGEKNEENNFLTTYELFSPNPNNGFFTLNLKLPDNIITVRDITGRIIFNAVVTLDNPFLDLTEQPDGIYFITLSNGREIKTGKLIIQK